MKPVRLMTVALVLITLVVMLSAQDAGRSEVAESRKKGKKKILKDIYLASEVMKNVFTVMTMWISPVIHVKGFFLSLINTLIRVAEFFLSLKGHSQEKLVIKTIKAHPIHHEYHDHHEHEDPWAASDAYAYYAPPPRTRPEPPYGQNPQASSYEGHNDYDDKVYNKAYSQYSHKAGKHR